MNREMEIVGAAVAWWKSCVAGEPALDTPLHDRLCEAIEAYVDLTEYGNEPIGPPASPRPWGAIPAGWFVQMPKGGYAEVTATRLVDGRQMVTLRLPDGKEGTWPRPPESKVPCRRGSRVTEVSDALDVLGEGARILEDGP